MSDDVLTGASLEESLRSGDFDSPAADLVGMVKAGDEEGKVSFSPTDCESWVEIPTDVIESAEKVGDRPCRDHNHPVFRLRLKSSDDPMAQTLMKLLATRSSAPHGRPSSPGTSPMRPPGQWAPPMRPPGQWAPPMRSPGQWAPPMRSPGQWAPPIGSQGPSGGRVVYLQGDPGGGPVVGGGGENAWGCYCDDCCCCQWVCNVWVNRYFPGLGWQRVCDDWECAQPCPCCIWPW
jgi:hypothetical protein